MTNINQFVGEYRFLSNFFPAVLQYRERTYRTAEHAYQAMKSVDPIVRDAIAACETPSQAKRLGRTIKVREDWNDIKLEVMKAVVFKKFSEHRELGDLLIATRNVLLVEGNTWNDTYWGVNLVTGLGQNHLGQILMQVRTLLQ